MTDIHVSIDLETLATRPDGVILAIAAAARLSNGETATYLSYCNVYSQQGRMIDEDTVNWWKTQGDIYRQTMDACDNAPTLSDTLGQFADWYTLQGDDNDRLYPWGNGANFDIAFLEHAFKEAGIPCPWQFWTARDLRTLKDVTQRLGKFETVKRVGTHHNALDDAITQLNQIEQCMEAVNDS
ncbi:3'-5' exonuclease [Vreelandella jeotgali]|uniref:3'-5' exonuclease n=1 Tax=Vreelandella jeotgali TaxID=553386 RepID=UPI00034B4C70|nr:3'-5' exonuclease [Halomonas jeotgali]